MPASSGNNECRLTFYSETDSTNQDFYRVEFELDDLLDKIRFAHVMDNGMSYKYFFHYSNDSLILAKEGDHSYHFKYKNDLLSRIEVKYKGALAGIYEVMYLGNDEKSINCYAPNDTLTSKRYSYARNTNSGIYMADLDYVDTARRVLINAIRDSMDIEVFQNYPLMLTQLIHRQMMPEFLNAPSVRSCSWIGTNASYKYKKEIIKANGLLPLQTRGRFFNLEDSTTSFREYNYRYTCLP